MVKNAIVTLLAGGAFGAGLGFLKAIGLLDIIYATQHPYRTRHIEWVTHEQYLHNLWMDPLIGFVILVPITAAFLFSPAGKSLLQAKKNEDE